MTGVPSLRPSSRLALVTGIIIVAVVVTVIILAAMHSSGTETFPGMITVHATEPAGQSATAGPTLSLNTSPTRYSPLMSSTIGIGIEPVVQDFDPNDAVFIWNATYGRFLDWNTTTYQVSESGRSCRNNGDKLYWTFYDISGNSPDTVVITVTAQNKINGTVFAASSLNIGWTDFNSKTGVAMAVVQE
ncbi:MAG: hypothetical protein WC342_07330 [Methanoregula sp.]